MPAVASKSHQERSALRMFETYKEKIAVHEAGHALHALCPPSGRPFGVKRVEIGGKWVKGLYEQNDAHYTLGRCYLRYTPAWRTLVRDRELAEAYLVQALVGPAAEYRYTGWSNWGRCKELEGDLGRQHLIAHHALGDQEAQGAYIRWLQARATELVTIMWPAILESSARLVEKRKLSGEEVADILEVCWPCIKATYAATRAHRGRRGTSLRSR